MTGFLTPEEARGYDCPTARIHGDGKSGKCRADQCNLWRWLPLPAKLRPPRLRTGLGATWQ